MSEYDLTEAAKAAHRALAPRWMSVAAALSEDADYPALLTDVLTAALPHLEQQIREQVAAEASASGSAETREQWARKVAQELAATSIQSAQYIGQMVTSTLDALLAMMRASVIAEAKVEALREAADQLDAYSPGDVPDDPRWTCDLGYYGEAAWLRARADALEAGQS